MFIERLEKLLEARKITEYRLAKDIGVHPSTIHSWRTGRNMPTIELVIKLADYFGITTDELLR